LLDGDRINNEFQIDDLPCSTHPSMNTGAVQPNPSDKLYKKACKMFVEQLEKWITLPRLL
jgi:hypothetical protein